MPIRLKSDYQIAAEETAEVSRAMLSRQQVAAAARNAEYERTQEPLRALRQDVAVLKQQRGLAKTKLGDSFNFYQRAVEDVHFAQAEAEILKLVQELGLEIEKPLRNIAWSPLEQRLAAAAAYRDMVQTNHAELIKAEHGLETKLAEAGRLGMQQV